MKLLQAFNPTETTTRASNHHPSMLFERHKGPSRNRHFDLNPKFSFMYV